MDKECGGVPVKAVHGCSRRYNDRLDLLTHAKTKATPARRGNDDDDEDDDEDDDDGGSA